ncbi:hypothetical protein F5146DRAFT_1144555 [Armillaria mellea]|nr:hypothetical protein F5146DRAFT_1144555 [Armillaria mellea]
MALSPPHDSSELILTFHSCHVLLIALNGLDALKYVTPELPDKPCAVLDWFEREKKLVLVLTEAGRVFCAGADLKGWDNCLVLAASSDQADISANKYGFAGISRGLTAKPIIAAVNGADENAKFALSEVRRGVAAIQRNYEESAHTYPRRRQQSLHAAWSAEKDEVFVEGTNLRKA